MAPAKPENAEYDRSYYLLDCEGHREFEASRGRKLSRRLRKCLDLTEIRGGETFLDLGCGRGEVALHAAARGARTIALDPSLDALSILREVASADLWLRGETPHAVRARGEALPIRSASVDVILLSDIVEHLPPPTLARLLDETHRVLRPGGRLVVHTQPNRLLVDVTVPLLSRFSGLWGVRLPRDLRTEMSPGSRLPYHVNEQSLEELDAALRRTGFEVDEIWLEGSYPVHRVFGDGFLGRRILRRFRRSVFLKRWLASQIFARVHRPGPNTGT